jgi:hypothetical protein
MEIPETASLFISINVYADAPNHQHATQPLPLQHARPRAIAPVEQPTKDNGIDDKPSGDSFRPKKISREARLKRSKQALDDFESRLRDKAQPPFPPKEPAYRDALYEGFRGLLDARPTWVDLTALPDIVLVHLGRKRTVFVNIAEVCVGLRRAPEHL